MLEVSQGVDENAMEAKHQRDRYIHDGTLVCVRRKANDISKLTIAGDHITISSMLRPFWMPFH